MNGSKQHCITAILGAGLIGLAGCMNNTPEDITPVAGDGFYAQTWPPYATEPEGREEEVNFAIRKGADGLRTFVLNSTQTQRDDTPRTRRFSESPDFPRVYSGGILFDSLFAMAVDDMKLVSVSDIRDNHYNHGQAIPCECFETGEKWNYVWTRDLAYAADLSLADIDPQRVVNSLLFKTSAFRDKVSVPAGLPAGSTQIIQDTGSGGSWPVSTDRVSWAIAAERVLNNLSGSERATFVDKAYAALRGTIEADRAVAFDARAGLYGGEQSFLDWREQTYAPWITGNLSWMSSSKALSTNVAHYRALKLAARLAEEKGQAQTAQKYNAWAGQLKADINRVFWLEEVGQYASLTSSSENLVPVYKYDMLGNALAILSGVASAQQAERIMATYPHAEFGVPVYYPQQPDTPVYHNRGIWPFVTAYSLQAGAHVNNDKVVDNAIQSLIRGAALNLSNMENLEWLTAKPWFDDGPVINSRRQLWSVAGYLAMVQGTIFGYHAVENGIEIKPFLTAATRNLLGDDRARIEGIIYQGRKLNIELELPAKNTDQGYYEVARIELNGQLVSGKINTDLLNQDVNIVRIQFGNLITGNSQITLIPRVDALSQTDARVFSPEAPAVKSINPVDGRLTVTFEDQRNQNNQPADSLYYNIYRNGQAVAQGITRLEWQESAPLASGKRYCYAVEAVFVTSGNRSHHSEPQCYEQDSVQTIPVTDARVASNLTVTPAGNGLSGPALIGWGKPGDTLQISDVRIERSGHYALQIVYNNRQHGINSGVTAAVKWVNVIDANNHQVAQDIVQMPNIEDRNNRYPFRISTEAIFALEQGTYSIELQDYFNMSYLKSNSTYTGSGGLAGPVNTSSIAEFRMIYLGE